MSKGEATVDLNAGTIQAKDGAGHEEKLVAVNKADISFKLNTIAAIKKIPPNISPKIVNGVMTINGPGVNV